ncbi:unnamed protein product [Adineta ricciae]|uniref:Uncharacterized protein n=1 Tax=Adineta ricciae TaxID=249248 RepID=A0A815X5G7_ADIRI|nr:unnamed protein product [Adineta ricciae]
MLILSLLIRLACSSYGSSVNGIINVEDGPPTILSIRTLLSLDLKVDDDCYSRRRSVYSIVLENCGEQLHFYLHCLCDDFDIRYYNYFCWDNHRLYCSSCHCARCWY